MNIGRSIRSLTHRPRRPPPPPEAKAKVTITLTKPESSKSTSAQEEVVATIPLESSASDPDASTSPPQAQPAPPPDDPAPEFPLFSSLPFELRIKIFSIALRLPPPSLSSGESPTSIWDWNRALYQPTPPSTEPIKWPALLSVCRESREEAIMYYEGIPGSQGQFKTLENEVVGRMGNGDQKGRNRICVAGWWWDCSVVG